MHTELLNGELWRGKSERHLPWSFFKPLVILAMSQYSPYQWVVFVKVYRIHRWNEHGTQRSRFGRWFSFSNSWFSGSSRSFSRMSLSITVFEGHVDWFPNAICTSLPWWTKALSQRNLRTDAEWKHLQAVESSKKTWHKWILIRWQHRTRTSRLAFITTGILNNEINESYCCGSLWVWHQAVGLRLSIFWL